MELSQRRASRLGETTKALIGVLARRTRAVLSIFPNLYEYYYNYLFNNSLTIFIMRLVKYNYLFNYFSLSD